MKNIIEQWQDMTETDQIAMLTACTIKALQIEIPAATLPRFTREHERDELVSAAWLKLYDRLQPTYLDELNASRANDGKEAISLKSLVFRAARDTVRNTYADDHKHDHEALETEDEDENGNRHYNAWQTDKRRMTEIKALDRISIEDFTASRDHIDRIIIEGLRDGYTQRECAEASKVSAVAINKRVNKIRRDLTAAAIA